jgi:hypothetical protein
LFAEEEEEVKMVRNLKEGTVPSNGSKKNKNACAYI